MPKRIGLLGGTFNPIHRGHLQIAQAVFKRLKLDGVLFIPTGKPPHKKETDLASRTDRFRMVCLALEHHPHFKPCDLEIKRKGVSYTIDTLRALKRLYPDDLFFVILGTDAFSHLQRWKQPEKLFATCHFVIVSRVGYPFSAIPPLDLKINRTALQQLDEKKRKQYVFRTPHGTSLYFIRAAIQAVSASELRKAMKTSKNTLLPQRVRSYIMQKGVYLSK